MLERLTPPCPLSPYLEDRPLPFVVNTRSLNASRHAGVQRYVSNLLRALPGPVKTLSSRPAAGLAEAQLWEQVILPTQLRGRLLFSPANSGPVRLRRQVVTVHDVATLDHPEWFAGRFAAWYRWMLPRLIASAQHVITVSNHSRDRILALTDAAPDRVTAIPLGIEPAFRPADPAAVQAVKQRHAIDGRYALVVGSIEPRKNLATLFRAWSGWIDRPDDLCLVVAGSAGHAFAGSGFGTPPPGCRLIGRVADADLPALYSGATFFAFPSVYEGFGLPPLEAMACGTPVIVSNATSLPEVVGEAGLLLDPHDPQAWTQAMRHLIHDEAARRSLGAAGHAHAGRFSWHATAQATQSILEQEAAR